MEPLEGDLLAGIIERCEIAGFKPELQQRQSENGDTLFREVALQIPESRSYREAEIWSPIYYFKTPPSISNLSTLEQIVNSKFDKYRCIKHYSAIWSAELGVVECRVRHSKNKRRTNLLELLNSTLTREQPKEDLQQDNSPKSALRRILAGEKKTIPSRIELGSPQEGISVTLGANTVEHDVLCGRITVDLSRSTNPLTLRIEGVNVTTHDKAREILLKIGNAALFQLDIATGVWLSLWSLQKNGSEGYRSPRESFGKLPLLSHEYDPDAMALYWNARASWESPLLQFLSFYQVLEYFFPTFSQVEAQKAVRAIAKDPTFSVYNDTDVARLLAAIEASGWKQVSGGERQQLSAVIENCLTDGELKSFIESDEARKAYFESDEAKRVTNRKLSTKSSDSELREQAAERIYNIRCRIVHTKNATPKEGPLLPFSEEANHLRFDIDLLHFIAEKALVSSSRPMNLV